MDTCCYCLRERGCDVAQAAACDAGEAPFGWHVQQQEGDRLSQGLQIPQSVRNNHQHAEGWDCVRVLPWQMIRLLLAQQEGCRNSRCEAKSARRPTLSDSMLLHVFCGAYVLVLLMDIHSLHFAIDAKSKMQFWRLDLDERCAGEDSCIRTLGVTCQCAESC